MKRNDAIFYSFFLIFIGIDLSVIYGMNVHIAERLIYVFIIIFFFAFSAKILIPKFDAWLQKPLFKNKVQNEGK